MPVVKPNYVCINAKAQTGDPNSVFSYYQKLNRMRKELDIVTDGHYELLDPENEELYCYTRTNASTLLLVVCSFVDHEALFPVPSYLANCDAEVLLCNYPGTPRGPLLRLRPYEAVVFRYAR